jgi:hypothetical protein
MHAKVVEQVKESTQVVIVQTSPTLLVHFRIHDTLE